LVSILSHAQDNIIISESRLPSVPEEYYVEEGDTLWGICEHYFDEPWRWPTVWALNPHITNPHWIYPGDVLRLRLSDGSRGVAALAPISYTVGTHNASQMTVNEGFIVEKELDRLGTLSFSPLAREYLAEDDLVYVEFEELDKVRIGQRFSIFEVVNAVYHPITDKLLGQKIRVMGILEIDSVEDKLARARIIRSFRELHRGLPITPVLDHYRMVSPRQNLLRVEGIIVDALRDLKELAQFHLVLVDRGAQDGVRIGNRFFVLRRGDGFLELSREEDQQMPWEQIGELLVVETREHSSTALITRSALEIRRGDRVEMQLHY